MKRDLTIGRAPAELPSTNVPSEGIPTQIAQNLGDHSQGMHSLLVSFSFLTEELHHFQDGHIQEQQTAALLMRQRRKQKQKFRFVLAKQPVSCTAVNCPKDDIVTPQDNAGETQPQVPKEHNAPQSGSLLKKFLQAYGCGIGRPLGWWSSLLEARLGGHPFLDRRSMFPAI
ncbi:hypothetical protein R1flu_024222 [Riccia fluitans]|uniref:Uncharacterized protein n=1 Tax=Riccia fluitans TaxID=41844 RepID=A0ABD1XU99_9MARC